MVHLVDVMNCVADHIGDETDLLALASTDSEIGVAVAPVLNKVWDSLKADAQHVHEALDFFKECEKYLVTPTIETEDVTNNMFNAPEHVKDRLFGNTFFVTDGWYINENYEMVIGLQYVFNAGPYLFEADHVYHARGEHEYKIKWYMDPKKDYIDEENNVHVATITMGPNPSIEWKWLRATECPRCAGVFAVVNTTRQEPIDHDSASSDYDEDKYPFEMPDPVVAEKFRAILAERREEEDCEKAKAVLWERFAKSRM